MSLSFVCNAILISSILALLSSRAYAADYAPNCTALSSADFSSLNTTILNATYYDSSATVDVLGTCDTSAQISTSLCRVQFVVNTSSLSAITGEAWLPTSWNERFLALGNGGLNGCIDYTNLDYGTTNGFASVASNNGHDGDTGIAFANNSEVLADFTSRSVHVETLVGKTLVSVYYGTSQNRSYYLGCSTGGRQGMYAALHYPSDFDGIVAGSPATNFNRLIGWVAMLTRYVGAPDANSSSSFISSDLWNVTAAEILRQCDGLDGVTDGVITEPDSCDFRPEELLCETNSTSTDSCLTASQVETLRLIYAPLYGENGTLLYSRFDPGAEANGATLVFSGDAFSYTEDWMKYVVDNDVNYDYGQFGLDDIARMDALDPGNISTFSGDFSEFRDLGGKLITYHGRADPLIASGNSKAFYNLIARTLGASALSLDDFYRLFLVPGMSHCGGGTGEVNFGGTSISTSQVGQGASNGTIEARSLKRDESSSNATDILLALVSWVEGGTAPDTIIGVSDDGQTYRTHCRYPMVSQWDGETWICSERG